MKKHLTAIALATLSSLSMANTKVDSNLLGTYKLVSNLEGECPEAVVVTEKENTGYAVWISFFDTAGDFITNSSFKKLNEPVEVSNGTCFSAGPVNPFCMESRKEMSRYDSENLVLERFYGKKTTLSNAKFTYVKLAVKNESQIEVTYMKMEKPMAHPLFTFTPIESAATDTAYYNFPIIRENFSCNYDR